MKTTLLTCAAFTVAICSFETNGLAQAASAPVALKPSPNLASDDGAINPLSATPAPRANNNATHSAKTSRKSTAKDFPPPLVVQFASSEGEILDGLTEDLNIMARLIERSLEREAKEEPPVIKMGVPLLINAGSPSVRAMYLESFGALFMIKVNFPLIGAVVAEGKKADAKAGSEWENAKRDLVETEPIDKWSATENDFAGGEFDARRVGMLKTAILQNLKDATNIRHLKPDEHIAVTVFGTPAAEAPTLNEGRSGAKAGRNAPQEIARAKELRNLNARSRRGTVMTIRVKKSEVDALASQQLTFEEFQKRATINSYFAGGYATTSLSSWAISGSSATRGASDARRVPEP